MVIAGWEAMADWYDAKQGEGGGVRHRTLIDPALLEVVGDVNGLRVLGLYRDIVSAPVPWRIDGKVHETIGFHRPLSWYFRTLRAAGFVVSRLEEPAPTEEFVEMEQPQGPWITQIPLHAVIESVKVGEGFLARLGKRL